MKTGKEPSILLCAWCQFSLRLVGIFDTRGIFFHNWKKIYENTISSKKPRLRSQKKRKKSSTIALVNIWQPSIAYSLLDCHRFAGLLRQRGSAMKTRKEPWIVLSAWCRFFLCEQCHNACHTARAVGILDTRVTMLEQCHNARAVRIFDSRVTILEQWGFYSF